MTRRNRIARLACALALAGAISTQFAGGLTSAAFAQGSYVTGGNSSGFLGIKGLSSRHVLQGSVLALVAYGVVRTVKSESSDKGKPAPAPQPIPATGEAAPAPAPAPPAPGG